MGKLLILVGPWTDYIQFKDSFLAKVVTLNKQVELFIDLCLVVQSNFDKETMPECESNPHLKLRF